MLTVNTAIGSLLVPVYLVVMHCFSRQIAAVISLPRTFSFHSVSVIVCVCVQQASAYLQADVGADDRSTQVQSHVQAYCRGQFTCLLFVLCNTRCKFVIFTCETFAIK